MADLKDFTDKQIIDHLIKNWFEFGYGCQQRIIGFLEEDLFDDEHDNGDGEPELLVDEMKRELFEEAAQKYTLEQLHELLKI